MAAGGALPRRPGIAVAGARGTRRLDPSGWPGETYQKPVVQKRYRLRVFGPLPEQPEQLGEFVMIATSYGNRDHWWIKPEN
jgi:hypothetical protein